MVFVLDTTKTYNRPLKWHSWTNPKKLGFKDLTMASSPVTTYLVDRDATSDDHLLVPEPAAATLLPNIFKIAKESDLEEGSIIALFKKKNYKIQMCVGIISNISRLTLSIFDTGARPNLVCTCFLLFKGGTASALCTTCLSILH